MMPEPGGRSAPSLHGPMAGVRVIDLGTVFAAPFAVEGVI